MLRHISKDELFSMTTKQRVELFEELLRSTGREGIEQTITSLRESDFYTAPASTKYHNNSLGGLLMHSLLVYAVAVEIYEGIKHVSPISLDNTKEESLILSALLHDVCKIADHAKKKLFATAARACRRKEFPIQCISEGRTTLWAKNPA